MNTSFGLVLWFKKNWKRGIFEGKSIKIVSVCSINFICNSNIQSKARVSWEEDSVANIFAVTRRRVANVQFWGVMFRLCFVHVVAAPPES